MRVLLIEDDRWLGEAVRDQIAEDGHSVDYVCTLGSARHHTQTATYDLFLLDLLLPDGRGLDFLREIRNAGSHAPVIILTALDQISDRITGLNSGADDYLTKPFDLSELSARVNAVARRYYGNPNPLLAMGDLKIDLAAHRVEKGDRRVALTAREWAIFETFVQRPEVIFSKDQLEERLYSFDDQIESNAIEVYISRLRKKLGAETIETTRGLGYRLGSR